MKITVDTQKGFIYMNKYIQFVIKSDGNLITDDFSIHTLTESNLEAYVLNIVNFFSKWTGFIDESNRVFIFNTQTFFYKNDQFDYIKALLEYSHENNKIEELEVLCYILYCFHYSYDKGSRYKNDDVEVYKNGYYTIFDKKEFYNNGIVLKNTINFMKKYINYILLNYNKDTLFYKIYNEISFYLVVLNLYVTDELQIYIDKLLLLDDYNIMRYIIEFDKNIIVNKKLYLNNELSFFKEVYNKTEFQLVKKLYKKFLIDENDENDILTFIRNKLINIEHKRKYEVNEIANNIIYMCSLIRATKECSIKLKDQLKKVKIQAEQFARENIRNKNENFLSGGYTIELSELDKTIKEKLDDISRIYNECNSNIELFIFRMLHTNFESILEETIKNCLDNALYQVVVQKVEIDMDNMLVKKGENKYEANIIRTYYSDKMNIIYDAKFSNEINSHIYSKNKAYRYLIEAYKDNNKINMHILDLFFNEYNIKLKDVRDMIIGLDIFRKDNLIDMKFNLQIVVMKIIIFIETALLTIYNDVFKSTIDSFDEKIIFELFNKFSNDNETDLTNTLAYVYMSIYDNMGFNIRNIYSHGNIASYKDNWNDVLIAIVCFRLLTNMSTHKLNIYNFKIMNSVSTESECEIIDLLKSFNDKNDIFGYIPKTLFEKNNINDLYYFYPMIERIFRFILHDIGDFDIENKSAQTFRTLFSIIDANKEKLVKTFDDEILYYLEETHKDDGVRNKVMHYNENLVLTMGNVYSAKYIFVRLVTIYLELKD